MPKAYKGSIKRWLMGLMVVVAILTSSISVVSFTLWYTQDRYEKTLALADTIGKVISQNVAKIILLNDVSAAADVTSALKSFHTLHTMVLYNNKLQPIFQYSQENKNFHIPKLTQKPKRSFVQKGNLAQLFIEASYQNTQLGYVFLEIQTISTQEILFQHLPELLIIFFLVLVVSLLLANYFAKRFTQPILKLVTFLEKIEFNHLITERITIQSDDEYAHLYDEINTMLNKIEHAHKALKLAAVAFETHNGMVITDKNHTILDANASFSKITGYSREEVIGQTPALLKSGLQDENFYKEMHLILQRYHYWSGEIYNKKKDGTIYPEYLTIQTVLDENQEVLYYVASFVDLSVQKKTEEQLLYLQKYDSLTGLANKQLLIDKIQSDLEKPYDQEWCALMLINIRDFKLVNEAFGYKMGDKLLQQLAYRLQYIEQKTLVARIEGNQFALWFNHYATSKTQAVTEAKILAEYIMNIVEKAYVIDKTTLHIISNIGITVYQKQQNITALEILQQAESALYFAKEHESKISFSNEEFQNIAQTKINIYAKLLDAIQKKEFELYYQPQYNTQQEIYSFEALIRWNSDDNIVITPDHFIPVSERTGIIIEIGKFVLEQACKQLQLWAKKDHTKNYVIAVNVSSKQFNDDDFIPSVEAILLKYNINPALLKIELTESIMVKDMQSVVAQMQRLKALGLSISLDDFGTGYSSLQYLRDLPLDQVKIDQSFVRNMLESPSDLAIIKSVLLICQTLNIDVIAEGVETKEHFHFLKDLGCEYFQGYYFSKPKRIQELQL